MNLEYEIMFMLITGVVAFIGGFRKAKSTCCCCSLDFERDIDNKLQAVKVVKRQRSIVQPEPEEPQPPPATKSWFG